MPNGESICFPFVENSEKISFNTKNFNKPHDLDNKVNFYVHDKKYFF